MLYYLKKHWKINLLTIILQIVYPVVSVLSSLALIQVTQGIFTMDMDYFVLWMGVDIVLWLCHVALLSASTWTRSRAIMLMKNSARADITATLLAKKYRDFHAQQTGEYLSWYTNDVSYMVSLGWNSVYSLTAVLSQVIFSILALAQMHWSLLVVSSVAAVVLAVFPKMFTKHLEKISETCSEKQAQAMSKMSDLLSGLDVLRSFGKTSLFIKGQQEASEQMERPQYKMNYSHGLAGQVINLVNVLCKLSVNVLIGFLSIQGTIIQSALLGGGDLCGKIYDGLAGISNYMMTIRSAKPYFARITVRANDDIRMGESGITPLKNGITVEHLGFGYGENPILIDTNMCFEKGGKYALTGPSGCGKSTLLKLLLGWLPEYTGKITFDGQNAKNFTSEQLQQQISYIEQDVFLFNTTIRDNITLGENYTDALIERAIKGSALDNDLANMPLGLDTPVGEDGSNLSGGQKQRVAIARALLHNRSILLVDEGTSALDQKNADIVEQSLLNNPDLTLILVSHHLSEERKKQFTKVYEMEPVSYFTSKREVATV